MAQCSRGGIVNSSSPRGRAGDNRVVRGATRARQRRPREAAVADIVCCRPPRSISINTHTRREHAPRRLYARSRPLHSLAGVCTVYIGCGRAVDDYRAADAASSAARSAAGRLAAGRGVPRGWRVAVYQPCSSMPPIPARRACCAVCGRGGRRHECGRCPLSIFPSLSLSPRVLIRGRRSSGQP